jgi:hypothetical protein
MKPKALPEIHREPAESENQARKAQKLAARGGVGDFLIRARVILFFTLVVFLLAGTSVRAQDPGFSQFFASPLTLNPALTGKFNGVVRVAGNYRNQWPSINNAFITSTISVDAPIFRNKLPENDTWGLFFPVHSLS